jgi:hypothetical protein
VDLMLQRQADCSLTYGNYALSGTSTAPVTTVSSLIPNYERTIHANAFLTTTPDQFPHGCTAVTQGANSAAEIYLGKTKTSSSYLGATVSGDSIVIFSVSSGFDLVPPALLTPDRPPFTIVGGDLNKDGSVDLLSINTDGINSSVSVFISNGDGTYKTPVNYEIPNVVASFGVVDDMNADGNPDLVVGTGSGTSFQYLIYLGKGDGTFAPAVPFVPGLNNLGFFTRFTTADVNGDGAEDIITSQGQVFLGTRSGTTFTLVPQAAFPPVDSATNGLVPGMVATDFNNDGKLDLATDDGITIRTYLGKGDGTFSSGNSYSTIANRGLIVGADIDGDGNADLYSGFGNSGVYAGDDYLPNTAYALMGNGDGTFQGAPTLPFNYTGTNLLDLNNDGRADLVGLITTASQTTLTTYLTGSNGIPVAGPALVIPAGVGVDSYALGAFNTNSSAIPGLLYLTASPQVQTFNLALGVGDGSFQAPAPFPVPTLVPTGNDINESLTGLRTGDFNHDGKLDIAYSFSDQASDTQIFYEGFAVQLGNGDGTFQAPKITVTYQSATAPGAFPSNMLSGIVDVNNDNFPDVFMVIPNQILNGNLQHQVLLFVGKGDGTFAAPNTLTLTPNTIPSTPDGGYGSPFALADLNGDGKMDLVAAGSSADGTTPQVAIALGNGNGTFQPPTILTFDGFGYAQGVAIADFDGDGKLDLSVQTGTEGIGGGIFPGNGDGTFTTISNGDGTVSAPEQIFLNLGSGAVATDLNKDGVPDLIAGSVVLLNKSNAVQPVLAATSTVVTSSLNPSTSGASVTFTAAVSSATAGTITGTVTFLDGATSLGMGTLAGGMATFATSSLAAGSHSITAQYGGDTNYATSISPVLTQTVNAGTKAATTTAVTSSLNPSTTGTSVTFTAAVTSATAGTITGAVTFLDGATSLGMGTLAGGMATFATSSLAAGSHSITAQYGGDANYATSTSPVVTQTVNAAADFSVSASPGNLTIVAGQSGTVAFTVTPQNGSTQTVSFSCSGLPSASACAFVPMSITLDGTHAAMTQVTISTTARTVAVKAIGAARPPILGQMLGTLAICIAGIFGLALFRPRHPAWRVALALLVFTIPLAVLISCANGPASSGGGGTPAGTSSVIITATSGTDSHAAPAVTLTVQ